MASIKTRSSARQKEAISSTPIATQHVGKQLREAREVKSITIESVSNELMIRKVYLEALENGTYKELPERVYATGFVRSYAQFMGLDPNELADQFKREAYGMNASYRVELTMPEPIIQTVVPSRGALIGAISVVVILSIGIYLSMRDTTPPPVAIPEAPVADTTTELVAPMEKANDTASFNLPESASIPATSPDTATVETAPPAPAVPEIFLEAVKASWTEIKDANGVVLYTGMLKEGQKLPIPNQQGMTLSTGNAGGLRLVINNEPQAALGNNSEVKRSLALDPLLTVKEQPN